MQLRTRRTGSERLAADSAAFLPADRGDTLAGVAISRIAGNSSRGVQFRFHGRQAYRFGGNQVGQRAAPPMASIAPPAPIPSGTVLVSGSISGRVTAAPPALTGTPVLSLVAQGGSASTGSILAGTATFSLDLRVNSDGMPINALTLLIDSTAGSAVTYASTPLTVLNNPFIGVDIARGPSPQAPLAILDGGGTVWLRDADGDYPALNGNAIGTYHFNTSALLPGVYRFTPVGLEFGSGIEEPISNFGAPGFFTLTVVPEPGTGCLLSLGGVLLAARRMGNAGSGRSVARWSGVDHRPLA